LLQQSSVSGVSFSLLVSELRIDNLSTFCDKFKIQCAKLMLIKFLHLWFYSFVCCQNVTCVKHFTRYGHYTGEVKDTIIARLAIAC